MLQVAVLVLSTLAVCSWYVWNWDLFFNSDFAMIGLVGRQVAKTGEQFIYVPKVNYQGLLIEGNLSALLFKLFGDSPQVLHLTAALVFCVSLRAYFCAIEVWFSKRIAFMSTLLMVFSSPAFFGSVLRTQPNYGETFALGCFLFWCFRKYQATDKPRFVFMACFASGFGFYLYSQIIFFVLAVLGCCFVDPKQLKRNFKTLICAGLLLIAPTLTFGVWKLPGATLCFVLIFAVTFRSLWEERAKMRSATWMWGTLFFLMGYSPSLYFRISGQGKVVSHLRFIQYSEEFWARVGLFLGGFDEFMVSIGRNSISLVLCWLVVAGFFWFLFFSKDRRTNWRNPFFLLGFLVVGGFWVSRDSIDFFTLRYVLAWQLVFNLVIALLFEWLWARKRVTALFLFSLVISARVSALVFYEANHIGSDWKVSFRPWRELEPVSQYFKSHNLRWAYGDYWAAYLINFCTKGELNVEPLYSNYLPFYEVEIGKQKKLGLILPLGQPVQGIELSESYKKATIRGITYELKENRVFGSWEVWVLEVA